MVGDNPPFHTPVFVLTRHERPSFTLADTTFHFLNASPAEALAREAGLLDRFHLESVPSPSGVTHLLFWRR